MFFISLNLPSRQSIVKRLEERIRITELFLPWRKERPILQPRINETYFDWLLRVEVGETVE